MWQIFRCVRKLKKNNNQLHHVCLSAWNSAPTAQTFMTFDIWLSCFFENLPRKFKFHYNPTRIWHFTWIPAVNVWEYLAEFYLESEIFKTNVVEKIKDIFYIQQLFSENRVTLKTMWRYVTARHAIDGNRAHALCMLDNCGYRHALRIYNIYCSFRVTIFMRKWLNAVLYIYCLSCFSIVSTAHMD
jgi:hypothetical protein